MQFMAFDYIFKRTMALMLASCNAKAEKVGNLPLEIDTVARCKTGQQATLSIPLLAKYFSTDNLLEYKSEADKADKESLSKLLGYIGLYADQHSIGIEEMRTRLTAWYITAKHPKFIDELLAGNIATTGSDDGVYEIMEGFPCPCRIVICDELDVTDDNIPLLVLGSIETIKKAIVQLSRATPGLRNTMETIISLIFLFYRDKVKDMTEIKEILPADVRRSMLHTIEDIGLEEMIKEIGFDKVIDAIGIDKVIDTLGINKVIDSVGIENLKEAISCREEEKRKLVKKARKSRKNS